MLKRILLYIFVPILLVLISGCMPDNNMQVMHIDGNKLAVEVVDTPESRYMGLSNREYMPQNEGMLFVFDNLVQPGFVMRDMKFNLDIIWIRDNVVIGCVRDLAAPQKGQNAVAIEAEEDINYVVEVNAGWCARNDISKGDRVDF